MFDSGVRWLRETVPAPASLSGAELIDAMVALARVESAVTERKLALIAELADQRIGEQCDAEQVGRWDCDGLEIAESEISAALTTARQHAGTLITLGITLRDRLPHVRAALARGEVERQVLDKALAPTTPGGTGLTGRRLRNVCARIVGAVDPSGVRERRRQARHDRHVGGSSAEDAMVTIFGSLPAEDGRKLDTRLRELATTVCPHDPRTFAQRKADAVGALVDGYAYLPCTCGREDCTQQPPPDISGWVVRKPLVHVTMLASTLHGDDHEPGYLDGYGLIDAEHARHLAADTAIVDAAPLPESANTYRPSAVLDTWIRILGGMCQWLHCDAPAWCTDLDHDTPFSQPDPAHGGSTTAAGMKPYCRPHHRMKHSGPWAQRRNPDRSIDLLAPTGHHYRTRTGGYLDLLGIDPDRVIDPDDTTTRRRRTRAQNKAARIRAERRHQQTQIDLAELGRNRSARHGDRPPPGDDPPCPF